MFKRKITNAKSNQSVAEVQADQEKAWHDQVRTLSVKPDSPRNQFRSKRFLRVASIVADILRAKGACRILDVGGTEEYWITFGQDLDWSKLRVTLVNLTAPKERHRGFEHVTGDARCMSQFGDASFDFVHSNSVIEHVGRWPDMKAMAGEVSRLAPRYFVQTPYFWFPIEPHFRLPFFHWIPESWRYRIVMSRGCGYFLKQSDVNGAMRAVESAVLLDHGQMQALFPEATIERERVLGMTKSLMAIR